MFPNGCRPIEYDRGDQSGVLLPSTLLINASLIEILQFEEVEVEQ